MNDLIKDLQGEREELANEINVMAIRNKDGNWTDEDDARFEEIDGQYETVKARLVDESRKERISAMQAKVEEDEKKKGREYTRSEVSRTRTENRYGPRITNQMRKNAFLAYARPGQARSQWMDDAETCGLAFRQSEVDMQALLPDEMYGKTYSGMSIPLSVGGMMDRYRNQQATDPGTAGGNTVPDGMMQALEIALLQFGPIRGSSTIVRTADGREIPWPTVNDTANKGEIIGENVAVNQLDVVFGQVLTKPYKYSSKKVPVSIELMQDSATNMDTLLGRLLGERIGRIQSDHYTTGSGTGEPTGIVTAAADSTFTITAIDTPVYDDFIDLKHSVDPAYRQVGQGFMFNDLILAAAKKVADTQGFPIWKAGLATTAPDTIDGDPYVINQSMPVGALAKCMLYGQLDKYIIHDAMNVTLIRLNEVGAESGQVIFLAWARSDGTLLDAGTEPVKYLSNPA